MQTSKPDRVMVIRHAEKPPGQDGNASGVTVDGVQDSHSLIPRGWQRAGALAVLFGGRLTRPGLSVPQAVFCADYGDTQVHRVYQTLVPVSELLQVQIQAVGAVDDPQQVVDAALGAGTAPVLICWEHQNIPDLVGLFGVDPATPVPVTWPSDRFDLVWVLDLGENGAYAFSSIDQTLLSGDAGA